MVSLPTTFPKALLQLCPMPIRATSLAEPRHLRVCSLFGIPEHFQREVEGGNVVYQSESITSTLSLPPNASIVEAMVQVSAPIAAFTYMV